MRNAFHPALLPSAFTRGAFGVPFETGPIVEYFYYRPGGVDRYLRPDGTSFYLRP